MVLREVIHHSCLTQATIGFLGATKPPVWSEFVAAFEQRLRTLHWVNGSNVVIEYQWAEGNQRRYFEIAQDFANRDVNIIVTSGTSPVLEAKRAAPHIPIVFA